MNSSAQKKLRTQWLLYALVSLGVVFSIFFFLRSAWQPALAWRWLMLSALPLSYTLWFTYRALATNHRPGQEELLPTFGPGNWISLLRGVAISMVAGFLFSPWPAGAMSWLPMLLYTVADIADYFDGFLARLSNQATLLGEMLDIEFDGLGMLIVSFLAVWYGQLPWWYLLLGIARYWFLAGLWWRKRVGLPIHPLHPSAHRRMFAGIQMGFMSAVLWPIMPPAFATIAGTIIAIPTVAGFLRDWLVVSGRIQPKNPSYLNTQRQLVVVTRQIAPPILRALFAGLYFWLWFSWREDTPLLLWARLFTSWRLPGPEIWAWIAIIIFIAGGGFLMIGWLPRFWAFWLVFPLGFDMVTRGLLLTNGVALGTAVAILLLGSGPYSLWQPEERFLLQRAAEDPSPAP